MAHVIQIHCVLIFISFKKFIVYYLGSLVVLAGVLMKHQFFRPINSFRIFKATVFSPTFFMSKLKETSADYTLYKAMSALQFLLIHWQRVCVFQNCLQLSTLLFFRTNIINLHFTKMSKSKRKAKIFCSCQCFCSYFYS